MASFDACEGNPGALTFMCQAYMGGGMGNAFKAECAFQRVINAGIKGSRLYQLWNDCCGRDTDFALEVMAKYDIEDIKRHIDGNGCYGEPFERRKDDEAN